MWLTVWLLSQQRLKASIPVIRVVLREIHLLLVVRAGAQTPVLQQPALGGDAQLQVPGLPFPDDPDDLVVGRERHWRLALLEASCYTESGTYVLDVGFVLGIVRTSQALAHCTRRASALAATARGWGRADGARGRAVGEDTLRVA